MEALPLAFEPQTKAPPDSQSPDKVGNRRPPLRCRLFEAFTAHTD